MELVLSGLAKPTAPGGEDKIVKAGNNVLGYIQAIGTLIAVGVLMFLGIKYMTASPSEKSDLKKSLIPYVIGAVILLFAVNLMSVIQAIGNTLLK